MFWIIDIFTMNMEILIILLKIFVKMGTGLPMILSNLWQISYNNQSYYTNKDTTKNLEILYSMISAIAMLNLLEFFSQVHSKAVILKLFNKSIESSI